MEGRVKFYKTDKAFGFISIEGEKDVFFHKKGLANSQYVPQEGDAVQFETEDGPKGRCAVDVEMM